MLVLNAASEKLLPRHGLPHVMLHAFQECRLCQCSSASWQCRAQHASVCYTYSELVMVLIRDSEHVALLC